MKRLLQGILIVLFTVFLTACSNKTLSYQPGVGFSMKDVDATSIEACLYRTTSDGTWEKLGSLEVPVSSINKDEPVDLIAMLQPEDGTIQMKLLQTIITKTDTKEDVDQKVLKQFDATLLNPLKTSDPILYKEYEIKNNKEEQAKCLISFAKEKVTVSESIPSPDQTYDVASKNLENYLVTIHFQ